MLPARVRRANPVAPPATPRVHAAHAVPSGAAESVNRRMRPATERAAPGGVSPRAAEPTSSARRVSGPRPHASSAAAARRCRDRRADAVVAQQAGGAERAVRARRA